ncbi:hypothetical protein P9E76_21480 [Schinkia azotoformans]|uniref:Uncharacterized protein n=1 Tax=Schinkia azotoformans LMG 9581 TaxID=1131731 RepID=K6DR12_SCHAZ|nr:hypothetical protein [Schinkia azotoformans]EKN70784.1 hypothetical protein BAZO_00835 [Schinkia azotoformans LMG 9581]MEC1641101.1 hypothetical protein [Schinkia azotoformans]MEC1722366.1 hypothetical protein [Schinkia azotoformans]MEC1947566.1 hypothetical protein [Schinkia azotoformans]MED4354937.1 hypothetical protein [Schinkia azotoformans]
MEVLCEENSYLNPINGIIRIKLCKVIDGRIQDFFFVIKIVEDFLPQLMFAYLPTKKQKIMILKIGFSQI